MVLGVVLGYSAPVLGAAPGVLITAIQTSGVTAGQEIIKLKNTSRTVVDLSVLRLEYLPARPKDITKPSRVIKLSGKLNMGQEFTLAAKEYSQIKADLYFNATMSASGGHLRLMGSEQLDLVGWGTAGYAKVSPAKAPMPGQKLIRKTVDDQLSITGDNSKDFILEGDSLPSVKSGTKPSVVPFSGRVKITELFPDPIKPDTDAKAEFIELQNIGPSAVNLEGLILLCGKTLTRQFKLPAIKISAGRYISFAAPTTKLSLANSGGRVQLRDHSGRILSDIKFPKAFAGASWALNAGKWAWTTSPSPGKANVIVTPKPSAKRTRSSVRTTLSRGKVMSDATAKAVKVKAEATTKPPLHSSVVAGVGSLAVLYGVYEYRQDLANAINKLRRHRKNR